MGCTTEGCCAGKFLWGDSQVPSELCLGFCAGRGPAPPSRRQSLAGAPARPRQPKPSQTHSPLFFSRCRQRQPAALLAEGKRAEGKQERGKSGRTARSREEWAAQRRLLSPPHAPSMRGWHGSVRAPILPDSASFPARHPSPRSGASGLAFDAARL
ncbi:unnamed protein product [Coccothraustes coccothraustes]